jgi:hypothetical protein
MHEFSGGSRACLSGKFLNLDSLKCHFLDFGERFYRILMVRKRHCNISEALANAFALSPKPGAPHLAHWGWGPPGSPGLSPLGLGAPGFSRSEPIVVTPLACKCVLKKISSFPTTRFRRVVYFAACSRVTVLVLVLPICKSDVASFSENGDVIRWLPTIY